jgi:hypothetical protein
VEGPPWLLWLAVAAAVILWRRVVRAAMRAGRLGPRAGPAVYAAIIPALVLAFFALSGAGIGLAAVLYAALGFVLSYSLAAFSFRREPGGGEPPERA